jgi:hypothetical protein
MEIDLGWGRKPLSEQLSGAGFVAINIEHAEKDADAILRLHMRSLITDKMRDHAIKNMVRRLAQSLEPIKE